MLFRCIKSINTTVLEVDCGVVPLEGNGVTKVNKKSVLCNKAIVIDVRACSCRRRKEDIAENGVCRVKVHSIHECSHAWYVWLIRSSRREHMGSLIALPLW